MRHLIYYALFCLLLLLPGTTGRAQQTGPTVTPTQDEPQVTIRFPVNGQAVQGNVVILGDTAVEGFQSAELTFSYSDNPTDTWFLIQLSDQPVSSGALAEWDTSTITDGDYDLRLTVSRQGGEPLVSAVNGLRVRNYTPIETSTPTPVTPTATPLPGDTPIPSQTPTPTITPVPPTATLLPTNPAEITRADVSRSLRNGVLVAFGLFALLGIYFSIRMIRSGPE